MKNSSEVFDSILRVSQMDCKLNDWKIGKRVEWRHILCSPHLQSSWPHRVVSGGKSSVCWAEPPVTRHLRAVSGVLRFLRPTSSSRRQSLREFGWFRPVFRSLLPIASQAVCSVSLYLPFVTIILDNIRIGFNRKWLQTTIKRHKTCNDSKKFIHKIKTLKQFFRTKNKIRINAQKIIRKRMIIKLRTTLKYGGGKGYLIFGGVIYNSLEIRHFCSQSGLFFL